MLFLYTGLYDHYQPKNDGLRFLDGNVVIHLSTKATGTLLLDQAHGPKCRCSLPVHSAGIRTRCRTSSATRALPAGKHLNEATKEFFTDDRMLRWATMTKSRRIWWRHSVKLNGLCKFFSAKMRLRNQPRSSSNKREILLY
jgi:hypothetical protein